MPQGGWKNCKPCQIVSEHNVCFQSFGLGGLRWATDKRWNYNWYRERGSIAKRLLGSMRVISYSALGQGAPPFLKTQSQRGMNYWFCYSDQPASLSSLTLCRPAITLKGIWQGKKKGISTQASPPACTSSLKPCSLRQPREVKGRKDLNTYLMSQATWFTLLPTVTRDGQTTLQAEISCKWSSHYSIAGELGAYIWRRSCL